MLYSKETLDAIEKDYHRLMAEGEEARQILLRNGRLQSAELPRATDFKGAAPLMPPPSDGLRAAILATLGSFGSKWTRPIDVTTALERSGYDLGTSKTPLRTRVGGDLARMVRDRHPKMEKRGGKYRLVQQNVNGQERLTLDR